MYYTDIARPASGGLNSVPNGLQLRAGERISDMEFYDDLGKTILYTILAKEDSDGGSYRLFKQTVFGARKGSKDKKPKFGPPEQIASGHSYKPEAITTFGTRLVMATDSEVSKSLGCEDFMFSVEMDRPEKPLSFVNIDEPTLYKGCSGLCTMYGESFLRPIDAS
jgi:hypothetical protein